DGASARHRLEDRLAERLDEARRADDVRSGQPSRHRVVRHATDDRDAVSSFEPPPQGAVADEREAAASERGKCVGEAEDVLPFGQAADADEARAGAVPVAWLHAEALEVDARVDDLDLAAGGRQLRLELPPQIVRDGD